MTEEHHIYSLNEPGSGIEVIEFQGEVVFRTQVAGVSPFISIKDLPRLIRALEQLFIVKKIQEMRTQGRY